MNRDSRLSRVLHVLLHMARFDRPVTSEVMAQMLGTNPVVVRRTMAGLRDAGLLRSEKGHNGGWSIACDFRQVTLYDLYLALGEPTLFAIGGANDSPGCLVEQAVNTALDDVLRDAEARIVARLRSITLADLAADFAQRFAERQTRTGDCSHVA